MVLTHEQAQQRIQELLAQATKIMEEVSVLAVSHDLAPSFLGQTFRTERCFYGDEVYRLTNPGWYSDKYWNSSDADCELEYINVE